MKVNDSSRGSNINPDLLALKKGKFIQRTGIVSESLFGVPIGLKCETLADLAFDALLPESVFRSKWFVFCDCDERRRNDETGKRGQSSVRVEFTTSPSLLFLPYATFFSLSRILSHSLFLSFYIYTHINSCESIGFSLPIESLLFYIYINPGRHFLFSLIKTRTSVRRKRIRAKRPAKKERKKMLVRF